MNTTPTQPHRNSNTHRTKNNTTKVVIQQNSHRLLMMDILMPETCWACKKWNKIASEIKLVFYSSTSVEYFYFNFLVYDIWVFFCVIFECFLQSARISFGAQGFSHVSYYHVMCFRSSKCYTRLPEVNQAGRSVLARWSIASQPYQSY